MVYSIPDNFAGRPICKDELPNDSIILAYRIIEPNLTEKGGIFFWLLEKKNYEEKLKLNPFIAFNEIGRICPISYGIPYDRKLHEQLEEANSRKNSMRGGILMWKKGKGNFAGNFGGGTGHAKGQGTATGRPEPERGAFEVLNPIQLLPSKEAN